MEQNSRKTEPQNRGNGVMKKVQMQLNGQSFHQIVLGQLHVYTPKGGWKLRSHFTPYLKN